MRTAILMACLLFGGTLPALSQAASFSDDALLKGESCSGISVNQGKQFLKTYFVPLLALSANADEGERQLIGAYAVSGALLTRSQICLASAMGLDDLVGELNRQMAVLGSGSSMSKKEMKKFRVFSDKANEQLKKAAESSAELSVEQKKSVAIGTGTYSLGAYATGVLFDKAQKYAKKLSEEAKQSKDQGGMAGLSGFGKSLKGGLTLAAVSKSIGKFAKSTAQMGSFLGSFAKDRGIELPADATSELGW